MGLVDIQTNTPISSVIMLRTAIAGCPCGHYAVLTTSVTAIMIATVMETSLRMHMRGAVTRMRMRILMSRMSGLAVVLVVKMRMGEKKGGYLGGLGSDGGR